MRLVLAAALAVLSAGAAAQVPDAIKDKVATCAACHGATGNNTSPQYPVLAGQTARYLGRVYRQQYAYEAETTYVAGEFYWQVQRGQKTQNRDYSEPKGGLLSMERSANELKEALRERLAAWKIPRKWVVVAEFPLTARGKTDGRRLRGLLRG